ncbi:MAG: hypothetical protein AAFS01_03755 [Pseudomonadota bacterium]
MLRINQLLSVIAICAAPFGLAADPSCGTGSGSNGCYYFFGDKTVREARPKFLTFQEFADLNPHLGQIDEETVIPAFTDLMYLSDGSMQSHNIGVIEEMIFSYESSGREIVVLVGSRECLAEVPAECGGIGIPTTVSDHLFNGIDVDQLNELNDLLEINENTIFPPNTMVRTR